MRGRLNIVKRLNPVNSVVKGNVRSFSSLLTDPTLEFAKKHANGGYRFPFFAAASTAAVLMAGAAILDEIERKKKLDRVNVELPTFKAMREYSNQMKQAFAEDNDHDKDLQLAFNALLNTIVVNNIPVAGQMMNKLIDLGAIITEEMRDAIIVFTSNHGKIFILETLQEVFGPEVVLRNRHARNLLSLSPDDKLIAQHFMEQYFQSPGEVKHDGMKMFVAVAQEEILAQMLKHRAHQPVYHEYDMAEDMAEQYRHLMSVKRITDDLKIKFERTLVVDLSDHDTFVDVIETYFRKLSSLAREDKGQAIVGTFITTGAHFTLGEIRVTHHHDLGKDSAVIVFIDPKGTYTSMQTNDYNIFASIAPNVFGDDVRVFISDEKNQLAGIGCSLFVSDQYPTLVTLDELMRANIQYKFAGNKDVLFDYADLTQSTDEYPYGVDFDGNDRPYGSYRAVKQFKMTRIPAVLTIGKQSLSGPPARMDKPELFILQPNGRYKTDASGEDKPTPTPGAIGVLRDMEDGSPERKMEFNGPADLSGKHTVKEVVLDGIENAEHNGEFKERNKRIDYSGPGFGFFLMKKVDRIITHVDDLIDGEERAGIIKLEKKKLKKLFSQALVKQKH